MTAHVRKHKPRFDTAREPTQYLRRASFAPLKKGETLTSVTWLQAVANDHVGGFVFSFLLLVTWPIVLADGAEKLCFAQLEASHEKVERERLNSIGLPGNGPCSSLKPPITWRMGQVHLLPIIGLDTDEQIVIPPPPNTSAIKRMIEKRTRR
eukprot:gb/GEZJ01004279.1/.p1 GENE.gb/GEZJ01004279.1/~~gb/GEZJ01004279.1/.p1  ORF type:complete len:152 (+),score=11.54 gb/GEZJ01004279.1/:1154-1609(+)